uniref:Fucolectin tachylectin-4 pentraxin-1 domain-containing protein n=1 Tax=Labrus bergylta TaxID=56723 RepID=A0A3Q3E9A8_9LABR
CLETHFVDVFIHFTWLHQGKGLLLDPLANVAPNGQATQSSLYANNVHAVNVINGDMTGLCSHTANQSSPWWKLDLLAVHRVRAVTIFNRPDCCPKRLIGAEILIGNSSSTEVTQNPRCGTISSVEGTLTHTFHCGDMEGRYVVVILPGQKRILSLCEVEVYPAVASGAEEGSNKEFINQFWPQECQ